MKIKLPLAEFNKVKKQMGINEEGSGIDYRLLVKQMNSLLRRMLNHLDSKAVRPYKHRTHALITSTGCAVYHDGSLIDVIVTDKYRACGVSTSHYKKQDGSLSTYYYDGRTQFYKFAYSYRPTLSSKEGLTFVFAATMYYAFLVQDHYGVAIVRDSEYIGGQIQDFLIKRGVGDPSKKFSVKKLISYKSVTFTSN